MPLTSLQRAPDAMRIMRTASEDLQQIIKPTDAIELGNTTLQDVQKVSLEIESCLEKRNALCNMRRLLPLFLGLEHFAKLIEALWNGTSFLPWIWAPLKLILKVNIQQSTTVETDLT